MAIHEHATHFAGKPIVEWEAGAEIGDPAATAYRLSLTWDEAEEGQRWEDKFLAFLGDPAVSRLNALVIGPWGDLFDDTDTVQPVIEALAAARDRLPALRAV